MSLFGWKKNIEALPIETMLLFEERQLLYLPEHGKRRELALVFRARPHIAWYVQNKAPALSEWMEALTNEYRDELLPEGEAFSALCTKLLESMEDWVVYVTAPEDYDTQVFTTWDFPARLLLTSAPARASKRLPPRLLLGMFTA